MKKRSTPYCGGKNGSTVKFLSKIGRNEVPFTWSVSCGMSGYARLAGVPLDRIFMDAEAIIEAYIKGRPLAEELFGPDVRMGGPTWQGISYGHANCLGAELIFPEDSEVAHKPLYNSLDEGISALKKEVDFSRQGMFPFYLDMWEKLKQAFPEEKITFHFKAEGPITTGWILRGHEFFIEMLTEPERMQEYLELITESVVAYKRLLNRINGRPEVSSEGDSLADDIAAMVAPDRWPDTVMPYLERYYQGLTSGHRYAHIEDLTAGHLKYLDQLGLRLYDPSVSPRLSPKVIRDNCSVPFQWRLNEIDYPGLGCEEIESWVFEAVAGGAARVITDAVLESPGKVQAFIRAAARVKGFLDNG